MDFAVLADKGVKIKENETRDKYLYLPRKVKKLWIMKVTMIPFITGTLGTISKDMVKGREELEIGDDQNYGTFKISQNCEKSPGDLRRFSLTQNPEKNNQLTMVWKIRR